MGAIEVYKLAPYAAFHFGLRGVGVEETASFCPADTIFSALCLTLRQWECGGNDALETWLEGFPPLNGGAPPRWRISSAFPYAGEVLFYPKPMVPANLKSEERQTQAKTLKKISFISEEILGAWLSNRELGSELRLDNLLHGGRVWVTDDERRKLEVFRDGSGAIRMWASQTVPRVTVDRATDRSAVYQAGVIRFKPEAGLFMLVEFLRDAQAERERFKTLLQVLGHTGLGGERSSGYGQFQPQGPLPFAGLGPSDGDRFLTLSSYRPTWSEVQAGVLGRGAAYELETRRGWVGAPGSMNLRRRLIRVLSEGSVLCTLDGNDQVSYGELVDVTPRREDGREMLDHKVWRYGIAFPLPVSVPLDEEEG